jgi:hypothetical protein
MTLHLDPAAPEDAKILDRQRRVAHSAGRAGRDRAKSTRGRADLEKAYDEGAASVAPASEDDEDQEDEKAAAAASEETAAADDEDQGDEDEAAAPPAAGPGRLRRGASWANNVGSTSWSTPRKKLAHTASQGGWVFLGMVGYALAMSVIRYGADGPKSWLSAKFLNKPNANLGKSSSTTSSTPSAESEET